jgi:hypothetical protein
MVPRFNPAKGLLLVAFVGPDAGKKSPGRFNVVVLPAGRPEFAFASIPVVQSHVGKDPSTDW